jgi:hypothetical protein
MSNGGSDGLEFVACDYCDAPFEIDTRYPVTIREDADGTIQLYSFCDETCQQAWKSEHLQVH